MSRVQKLSEDLILKIAAGEVIERPFSVVKELVENSLDAGAKNVSVEIEEGGSKKIVVTDDGIGMSLEDATLALQRHATSKIRNFDDLFRISTLGFRGEAIPSIASVSFFTLETKDQEGGDVAIKMEVEGGKIIHQGLSALPQGTRITIQNLFYNTPARLKFLKSKETEFSHIAHWLESMALSRPDVGFTLKHQGKVEIQAPATKDTKLRIQNILGSDITEFLHEVSMERNQLSIHGFISDHRASSHGAKSLFFYVNGRLVRDKTLQHAAMTAYENHLMKHRYPWVVLHLTVPQDFVDVNVHPAKTEVRFVNQSVVHDFVRQAVKAALHAPEASRPEMASVSSDVEAPRREIPVGLGPVTFEALPSGLNPQRELLVPPNHEHFERGATNSAKKNRDALGSYISFHQDLRIVGQVHQTYLVCETEDKLILIDQHAAHERIGYEALKHEFETGGIERQQLLIPQSFDLTPSRTEILKKYAAHFHPFGLEIDFFGGHTFLLRSTPMLLEGSNFVSLIEDVVDELGAHEQLTPLEERFHEVLERMACHRQIRAGDRLTHEETSHLIGLMRSTPHSNQCPHGRPTVLEVPFGEIEKWFKRRV